MESVKVVHPASDLADKSELAIFSIPPTQWNLIKTDYETFFPIAGLGSVVQFQINNLREHYLDLSSALLQTRFSIVRGDGSAPVTKTSENTTIHDEVYPVNNIAHSLWKSVVVHLNQHQITTNDLYTYRSYFDVLMHSSETERKTLHKAALYYDDEADQRDNDINASGTAFRYRRTKGGKTVDVVSSINSDIFNQSKLLLPGVDVMLSFHQNSDAFRLISTNKEQHTHKIQLLSVSLHIKKVTISPSMFLSNEKQLQSQEALYLLRGVDTKIRSLPRGSLDASWDDVYGDRLPSRLTIAFIPTESFQGAPKRDPLRLTNANLEEVILTVDGIRQIQSYDFSYNLNALPYAFLLQSIGQKHTFFKYENFVGNQFLIHYNLTADSSEYCLSPVRRSNVRLQCKFATALSEPTTVLLMSETPRVLSINAQRAIKVE